MHFRQIKQNFRWILYVTIMRTKNGQKYIVAYIIDKGLGFK